MQLNFMNLEIRRIRYPYDRVKYMGIVNEIGDTNAKLGTKYSYSQLQYFKAIIESISLGEEIQNEQKMSAVEAINLDEKKYAMTQDVVADSNRSQAVNSASKMTLG